MLAPVAGRHARRRAWSAIGDDRTTLRNLAVEFPAQALAGLFAARGGITLGGNVAVSTPAFDWNGTQASGALAAQWRDARLVVGGAVANLGAVEVALAPDGNRLARPHPATAAATCASTARSA